jgi:hypothetical protein
MPLAGVTFHHLGLALRDDTRALAFLEQLGYDTGSKIYDKEQNVYVRLCTAPCHPAVEVVMPGEGKTPLDTFLKLQPEMLYHTCYEVADVDGFLNGLKAANISTAVLAPPKPAVLFANRMVSFHHIRGYGIVELLDASAAS